MNNEKIARDVAKIFANSELGKSKFEDPQSKMEQILEDYCAAYGFVMSRDEQFIQELIHRGE